MRRNRKTWNQVWNPLKWQKAQEMREDGCSFEQIGAALGMYAVQIQRKFTNEGYANKASEAKDKIRSAMAQRDALLAAPRTLTQSLCGDPLPGRSAFDKIRRGEAP